MNAQPRLGRNEPCWCGSGKKYKHCHQHADQARASETQQKDALWQALGEFALQRKYESDFKTAAKVFLDADDAPDPEGDEDAQADFGRALDYFVFDYRLPDESRMIEQFARERSRALSPRQRAWLNDWLESAPALLEIVAVQRGQGVQARDLLTHEIYDIRDKQGSETAMRWEIAFTRVLRTDDHFELGGSGLNVPPRYRGILRGYVEGLRGEYMLRYPEASVPEFMRAHAHLIHQYILDEISAAMQQPLIPLTPERDLVEHSVAIYDVVDHARVLARLRAAVEFEELNTQTRDTHAFAWHETGESLAQLRVHGAPFERQTPVGGADAKRALGTLILSLDALTLDVMSRRRLRAGKALLENYLGNAVRFREEQIESLAEALAALRDEDELNEEEIDKAEEWDDEESDGKAWEAEDWDDGEEIDEELAAFDPNRALDETPDAELQELAARLRADYNEQWIDQRVPALDNQTPRQAVQTFGGRLQVIRLLKDFEAREARITARGKEPYDWSAVAGELGLSELEFIEETTIEDLLHENLSLLLELTALRQTDAVWQAWQNFRALYPFQRAEDLWFAEVWDLEELLTELAMELAHLLARHKRFTEARAVLDDYVALEAEAVDWALAERQAVEIERTIWSDPAAVQAAVAELERLAQDKDNAFQALVVLAELQEGLLGAPDAAVETLRRAEEVASEDMESQRVYDTLLEHFDEFRQGEVGKAYWHESNDELPPEERDVPGLVRLLLSCGELDEGQQAIEQIEKPETRAYFLGMLAARRGDLQTARQFWEQHLREGLEQFSWGWFQWAEMNLYLRESALVLGKVNPAARDNHPMAHWYRALAYAQQNEFKDAAHAADDARAAMRAQERRMEYDSTLRRYRALAEQIGLSDGALRALNLSAPVE